MNDDQLLGEVGAWLRDGDFEPPDARASVRRAMARTLQVRQRSRWWPLPVLGRVAGPPRMDQTAEFEPDPISATNGHTAIVTGRTRIMLSPAKASFVGAIVFAIGGAWLMAQPLQQPSIVPGAATEAGEGSVLKPALVTGRRVFVSETSFTEERESADSLVQRGRITEVRAFMSDERLSGNVVITDNADRFFDGSPSPERYAGDVLWGTIEITNDSGTWTGTAVGTTDDTTASGAGVTYYELVGSGGYEGLSAVIFEREAGGWVWSGVIFPGDLPPDR
jgi:hypothetical protein